MEKTTTLVANHKDGIVKVKWRYFDTYTSGTNPQWSSYYYASKSYETISTAIPVGNPPVPRFIGIIGVTKTGRIISIHNQTLFQMDIFLSTLNSMH